MPLRYYLPLQRAFIYFSKVTFAVSFVGCFTVIAAFYINEPSMSKLNNPRSIAPRLFTQFAKGRIRSSYFPASSKCTSLVASFSLANHDYFTRGVVCYDKRDIKGYYNYQHLSRNVCGRWNHFLLRSYNNEDQSNEHSSSTDLSESATDILYESLVSSLQKSESSLVRKQLSLQKELDKAQAYEAILARANLITANLYQLSPGVKRKKVEDWESFNNESDGNKESWVDLVLDENYISFQEEADNLFVQAKKMKRGSNVVSKLITEVKEGLDICQDASNHLSEYNEEIRNHDTDDDRRVNLEQIQFLLEKKKKKTGFIFSSIIKTSAGATPLKAAKVGIQNNKNKQSKSWKPKFRKFQSPAGTTILAGRNSRENDAISFQVACDGDIWMHARGYPGAHVLVIARRGSSQPTEECLQMASNIAAFYSDAKAERRVPVSVAKPCHVLKPNGANRGAVKLREELETRTGKPMEMPREFNISQKKGSVADSWDSESGKTDLGGMSKNRKEGQGTTKKKMKQTKVERKAMKKNRAAQNNDEEMNFY